MNKQEKTGKEEKIKILEQLKAHYYPEAIVQVLNFFENTETNNDKVIDVINKNVDLLIKLLQIKPETIERIKWLQQFTENEDDYDVFPEAICEEESIEAIRDLLKVLGDIDD